MQKQEYGPRRRDDNDSYGPDMSLSEAVRLGLVIVLDPEWLQDGAERMRPCTQSERMDYIRSGTGRIVVYVTCALHLGHSGPHVGPFQWATVQDRMYLPEYPVFPEYPVNRPFRRA